jgi:hypothetical protein
MSSIRDACRGRLPWLLLCFVLVVFAKCLPTFFVQDDFWLLRDTLKPIPSRVMLTGGLPEYLRPIPTYWLPLINKQLWGLSPFGFHISQMVCLLAAVYALYRVVFRWTQSSIGASAAALVYGLSKVHLYNVCWVAGGIDTTAGCFTALALLAIVRYEQGEGSLWSIGVAYAIALLSKESSIILVAAWGGAVAVRLIVARLWPADGAPQPTGIGGSLRAERRIALLLAGVMLGYAIMRLSLISARPELGLDFARFKYLIKGSIIAVLPIIEPITPISKAWILLPLATAAGAALLRAARQAHEAALGFLLWFTHAAIFAVSVKLPPLLQLYYAHFNVIGLALLCGLCCAGLVQRWSVKWAAIPVRWAAVLLLAAYAFQSAAVIRESIATSRSSPLYTARYSLKAYTQLRCWIGERAFRSVVFLQPSETMWWATGFGQMFVSMFPGIESHFDGRNGYHAPPGVKTDDATLVVRQVSEFDFEIVR